MLEVNEIKRRCVRHQIVIRMGEHHCEPNRRPTFDLNPLNPLELGVELFFDHSKHLKKWKFHVLT